MMHISSRGLTLFFCLVLPTASLGGLQDRSAMIMHLSCSGPWVQSVLSDAFLNNADEVVGVKRRSLRTGPFLDLCDRVVKRLGNLFGGRLPPLDLDGEEKDVQTD